MDPLKEAQYDHAEAERLRWQERQEDDPNLRKSLERAAQGYDSEADQIESEVSEEENQE